MNPAVTDVGPPRRQPDGTLGVVINLVETRGEAQLALVPPQPFLSLLLCYQRTLIHPQTFTTTP